MRIVSVEQYGAGPFGTLYLADMGADVVKIEDPATGGDVSRYIPPGRSGTESLFHESFNRGKRSIPLDLKTRAGREVLERLVAHADAIFSNLRGDQPAALRLRYQDLRVVNPAIVCVSLTGWGEEGHSATLPGYDALVQAAAGWAALTGDPDGPPTKSGLSLADYIGGLTAALGLLAALLDARRTGQGRDVRVNLYDAALAMLSYPATWFLSSGTVTTRQALSAHPSVVPFQFFPTGDGYIAIACPKEKFFVALMNALDLSELATQERFASFDARHRNRTELVELLSARFRRRSTADWVTLLEGVVPVAPVRSLEEALDTNELSARRMLAEYEHPHFGTVRSIGLPIDMDRHAPAYRRAPSLGGDQELILSEVGYSTGDIRRLSEEGAFGRAS